MAHNGMPRPEALILSKAGLLALLACLDSDPKASARALAMEIEFRSTLSTKNDPS